MTEGAEKRGKLWNIGKQLGKGMERVRKNGKYQKSILRPQKKTYTVFLQNVL